MSRMRAVKQDGEAISISRSTAIILQTYITPGNEDPPLSEEVQLALTELTQAIGV